jgi:hypothetical protein
MSDSKGGNTSGHKSGYLQRIAARAARPERSLHPFVSTVFAGAPREEVVETSLRTENPASRRVERAESVTPTERGPATRGEVGDRAPVERREETRSERTPVPEAEGRERSSQEIQGREAPIHEIESRESSFQEPQSLELLMLRRAASAREQAVSANDGVRETLQESVTAEVYAEENAPRALSVQPLLVEGWVPREEIVAEVLRPRREDAGVASQQRGAVRAAARERAQEARRESERGSEEIQIHIGRIEVIAVPQPVARPAAPANRSQSLDDYLKRHGRSR